MDGNFVAYYRVSTDRQGASGLGLDAQRSAVMSYLNGGKWKLVAEFTEVESGKNSDRAQLRAAQAACKKHKARLVIAKLDRLSRNVAFVANLLEAGTDLVAVDNPHANKPMTDREAGITSRLAPAMASSASTPARSGSGAAGFWARKLH